MGMLESPMLDHNLSVSPLEWKVGGLQLETYQQSSRLHRNIKLAKLALHLSGLRKQLAGIAAWLLSTEERTPHLFCLFISLTAIQPDTL